MYGSQGADVINWLIHWKVQRDGQLGDLVEERWMNGWGRQGYAFEGYI